LNSYNASDMYNNIWFYSSCTCKTEFTHIAHFHCEKTRYTIHHCHIYMQTYVTEERYLCVIKWLVLELVLQDNGPRDAGCTSTECKIQSKQSASG